MTDPADTEQQLANDLLRRMDPSGEFRELTIGLRALIGTGLGRHLLQLARMRPERITGPMRQAETLVEHMAKSALLLAPLGWAPTAYAPTTVYERALSIFTSSHSVDETEEVLVQGWNESERFDWTLIQAGLRGLGSGFEPLRRKFFRRVLLVEKALGHHKNGAYEASVPIILAQIEGISWDLTGRGFFTKKSAKHLVDKETVAGMDVGLKPLSLLFSQDMKESGVTGALSRHGILHGRELGYDTLLNSAKVFVLLIAVVEWAKPKAKAEAERLAREHPELAGDDGEDV